MKHRDISLQNGARGARYQASIQALYNGWRRSSADGQAIAVQEALLWWYAATVHMEVLRLWNGKSRMFRTQLPVLGVAVS